jgi:hypothetical protein
MSGINLKEFLEACDKELCPDCECCEMVWEECETCGGDGWIENEDYDEFMESDYDSAPCEICGGEGGHKVCIGKCDSSGEHIK